jgi:hypothetical protein
MASGCGALAAAEAAACGSGAAAALRCVALAEVDAAGACAVLAVRRWPSVERRWAARGRRSLGAVPSELAALARALAGGVRERRRAPPFGAMALGDGLALWPVVVREVRATAAGGALLLVAVPLAEEESERRFDACEEGGDEPLALPSVTAALQFLLDIEGAVLDALGEAARAAGRPAALSSPTTPAALAEALRARIEWLLSAAAPLGSPLESSERVLRVARERGARPASFLPGGGAGEARAVRLPAWKPLPASVPVCDHLLDAREDGSFWLADPPALPLVRASADGAERADGGAASDAGGVLVFASGGSGGGGGGGTTTTSSSNTSRSSGSGSGVGTGASSAPSASLLLGGAGGHAAGARPVAQTVLLAGDAAEQDVDAAERPVALPPGCVLLFHVRERVCAVISSANEGESTLGVSMAWAVDGAIECVSRLEGAQEVTVHLSGLDAISDANALLPSACQTQVSFHYHGCVRAMGGGAVPVGGRLTFVPPLGRFELCTYRVSLTAPPPLDVGAAALAEDQLSLSPSAASRSTSNGVQSAATDSSTRTPGEPDHLKAVSRSPPLELPSRKSISSHSSAVTATTSTPGSGAGSGLASMSASLARSEPASAASDATPLARQLAAASILDIGKSEARAARRSAGARSHQSTPLHSRRLSPEVGTDDSAGLASRLSGSACEPRLPLTGTLDVQVVSGEGATDNDNNDGIDGDEDDGDDGGVEELDVALDLLPAPPESPSGSLVVLLSLTGNARVRRMDGLVASTGRLQLDRSRSHVIWTIKAADLLPNPVSPEPHPPKPLARLAGRLVTAVSPACNPVPRSHVTYRGRQEAGILATPLRHSPRLVARLAFKTRFVDRSAVTSTAEPREQQKPRPRHPDVPSSQSLSQSAQHLGTQQQLSFKTPQTLQQQHPCRGSSASGICLRASAVSVSPLALTGSAAVVVETTVMSRDVVVAPRSFDPDCGAGWWGF